MPVSKVSKKDSSKIEGHKALQYQAVNDVSDGSSLIEIGRTYLIKSEFSVYLYVHNSPQSFTPWAVQTV
jgi:hypothetical protein